MERERADMERGGGRERGRDREGEGKREIEIGEQGSERGSELTCWRGDEVELTATGCGQTGQSQLPRPPSWSVGQFSPVDYTWINTSVLSR